MSGHDVLVVTLPPYDGGVPAKTRILCRHLVERGHRVSVAWYATFAHQSDLNVPSWRIPSGHRPQMAALPAFTDFAGHAIGCRFPELEAPYYRLSPLWRKVIDSHDRHIAVGGPPMVGNILAQAGVPHFLWCASDVMADRLDRQKRMPWPRSLVDRLITRPWLLAQQDFILRTTPLILGVSGYTLDRLRQAGAPPARLRRMPIPVDCQRFSPPPTPPPTPTIGFAARFEDPRKNLPLLLEAFALLCRHHPDAKLRLAGSDPSEATRALVDRSGLNHAVDFVGTLAAEDLAAFYQGLSVFALPSHQEGLCLAALEAMACGVPVVSTPCGGPGDFARDGINGALLPDWRAETMAAGLKRVLADRATLSIGARQTVLQEFSPAAFADNLAQAWFQVWGESP